MTTTVSLSGLAAFFSLGVGIAAIPAVPYFLLVDADYWAWPNLRPLVARVQAGVDRVRRAVCAAFPKTAVTAALLLMFLSPAALEGAR